MELEKLRNEIKAVLEQEKELWESVVVGEKLAEFDELWKKREALSVKYTDLINSSLGDGIRCPECWVVSGGHDAKCSYLV